MLITNNQKKRKQMKKVVSNFVKSLGGKTAYSGKTKTMFIKDPNPLGNDIEKKVLDKFGFGLPFRLVTSD